jgi:hypothetical protein
LHARSTPHVLRLSMPACFRYLRLRARAHRRIGDICTERGHSCASFVVTCQELLSTLKDAKKQVDRTLTSAIGSS